VIPRRLGALIPRGIDPYTGFDPRAIRPRGFDPRGIDPRGINLRGIDPTGH